MSPLGELCEVLSLNDSRLVWFLGINDLDSISETLDKHDFTNSKWFKLGLRLGISKPTLDSVEKHHISDIDRCLIECLTAWLKQTDNAKEPTWITLIDCLRSIKENAVADKISEESKIFCTLKILVCEVHVLVLLFLS